MILKLILQFKVYFKTKKFAKVHTYIDISVIIFYYIKQYQYSTIYLQCRNNIDIYLVLFIFITSRATSRIFGMAIVKMLSCVFVTVTPKINNNDMCIKFTFKHFDILLNNLLDLLFYFELIIRRAHYFYTSLSISLRKHFTEAVF